MELSKTMGALALVLGSVAAVGAAQAEDLKIGLVLTMSGPFADFGKQVSHGVNLYVAEHGDTVAGRKVRIIVKDDTGMAPAVAKRQAQELLVKDKVDILAGFDITSGAFSVAPLATEAKVPMVVMNAATSSVTEKSPYIVRTSMTMPQGAWAIAEWAYRNGVRKIYSMVADYGPGHDAEQQFQKTFTDLGGKIVGQVRTPLNTADYSPFLQRMRDAGPGATFFFCPPGSSMVALLKQFREMGLDKAGIKELGLGDMTDEDSLAAMGDAALGMITAFHYSEDHKSSENAKFVAAYKKAYPKDRPNFMAVGGYDGMHLIYAALEKTRGDSSGAAFMNAVKGMKWESPRGPVEIDPQTRDIIQNEYIRKLENVNGTLQNVEFYTFKDVKDPGK
jgi:branched-chain amino acid transport system substrate-binding protein